ncbi:MAG TPA: GAF and ANTAR domain-containing protein [Propionibacteriaceae bacterium]
MIEAGLPLADELAQLGLRTSPMLLSADTVTEAVEVLTSLADDMMIEASGAGVSLLDDQGLRTSTASTSPLVTEADDWQYQLDEGPCLTAWAEQVTIRIDDVDDDPRWPRWSAAVRGLPLRSVLSAPLLAGNRCLGAVKVYSAERAAFDSRSEHQLNGFARTAALLLANVDTLDNARQLSDDLRTAVLARDTIQLATGMVMHRDHIPRDAAWQQLVDAARTTGRSTASVAAELLSTVGRSI